MLRARTSRRPFTWLPLALLAVLAASCASATPEPIREPVARSVSGDSRTSHVIVLSVDGLRPDAIERFNAKTMRRLMSEGAHSLKASTILPSKTLPSHTSMLTGVKPDDHGVLWNTEKLDEHGHVATPTIFAAASDAGLHTAAFFSKTKFAHLAVPETLDYAYLPGNPLGRSHADNTIDRVENYLETALPNLLFVHLGEPDFVGHVFGWMSKPYGWAVRSADREIAELLAAADEAFGEGNYTLLLTSDHGGHGRDHGSDDPRDVLIPWIAWGEGVSGGAALTSTVRTVDTAATALWLLGLEAEEDIVGRPITEAFVGRSQGVATRAR